MTKKKKITAIIFALLSIGLTVFIFSNSLQAGVESAKQSDFVVDIANKILGVLGIDAQQHTLSLVIRKLGHFSEYFALGLTSAVSLASFRRKWVMVFSPVYCAVTAICDEFIMQRITEGRAPMWTDVLIDCSGALLALICVVVFICILNRKEKRYEK